MKQTLRILLLFCAVGAPAYAQTVIADNPRGFIGYESNELTNGSKVDDPAKYRCYSPLTEHGGGGCAISFNYPVVIGTNAFGGQQVELAMLRVEQAEDVRGQIHNPKAEFNFLCNDGSGVNDAAMQKCLSFTYDGITHLSPGILNSLRGLVGGGGGGNRFVSGPFMAQLNADGNFVIYDVSKGYKPVFDTIWLKWALAQLGYPYPY